MLKSNIAQLARKKALEEKREINPFVIHKETDIPYGTLYNLWHNKISSAQFEKLGILSRYFDCSIDDLFTEDETDIESNAPTGIGAANLVAR